MLDALTALQPSLLAVLLSFLPQGPTMGDTKVGGEVTLPMSASQTAEILNVARTMDPEMTEDIEDAMESGDLGLARLRRPEGNVGVHDKGTILLNGEWSPVAMAGALLHEWRHIQRIPSEAPPDAQDSHDNDDDFDDCAHARNQAQTEDQIICAASDPNNRISPEELCKLIEGSKLRGKKLWSACKYSSCADPDTGHDGGSYDSLRQKPDPDCPPPSEGEEEEG